MTGASARVLTWLAVMATLLTACTPAVDLPGTDVGQPVATSSYGPTAGGVATIPATGATQTSAQPQPVPPPVPAPPAPPQPFALNLYQTGDFVPQYTFDWCVAASIQMAHNLIDDTGGASWADPAQQGQLWEMARARSSDSFNGANPFGWAQVLTESGMGPYSVVSVANYEAALQTGARAMATTGRPVGLVMWSGRHAWVMSGFESVGDPALFPEFQVTGIRVMDPLYPYGSAQWGPSPEPNSLLTPAQLATQFVVREPRRWSSGLSAGYLLVLPVASA
ncbi:hypothetical protein ACIPY0_07170 [Paenarthrobacter nicotinovorans]|jgi:hypothetical protein|uniref:hypothetical protein n=1 Tax=Paenarthrobacter nicotinovorans TaxID=29320 RepID=UPI0027871774|nr:hypothetical protein [Paenarthrobacter nicotinovorans]MDP9937204.1 hypothetical protein [Paenarthrobacter nicotinovorans]